MSADHKGQKGDVLLEMRGIVIDGYSDDRWHEIIKGIDVVLRRGEIMGLIGESGAGKSTLGLAAMGFAQPGCKINGGSIIFDGIDLMKASEREKCKLRGSRIAYVAQSASASFNPSHRLIDQTIESAVRHGIMPESEAKSDARKLYRDLQLPDPDSIGERYPHQVSGGQLQRVRPRRSCPGSARRRWPAGCRPGGRRGSRRAGGCSPAAAGCRSGARAPPPRE